MLLSFQQGNDPVCGAARIGINLRVYAKAHDLQRKSAQQGNDPVCGAARCNMEKGVKGMFRIINHKNDRGICCIHRMPCCRAGLSSGVPCTFACPDLMRC